MYEKRLEMIRFIGVWIVLLLLVISIPLWVEAKLVSYSFDEMILKSKAIIVGRVLTTRGGIIRRPQAEVSVSHLIKGVMPVNPFLLHYGNAALTVYAREDTTELKKGHQYVMFLIEQDNKYRLVGAYSGLYEIDINEQVCEDGIIMPAADFIAKIIAVEPKASKANE